MQIRPRLQCNELQHGCIGQSTVEGIVRLLIGGTGVLGDYIIIQ